MIKLPGYFTRSIQTAKKIKKMSKLQVINSNLNVNCNEIPPVPTGKIKLLLLLITRCFQGCRTIFNYIFC